MAKFKPIPTIEQEAIKLVASIDPCLLQAHIKALVARRKVGLDKLQDHAVYRASRGRCGGTGKDARTARIQAELRDKLANVMRKALNGR